MESGLYCELTDKTLHDGYIEYILLYDMIANRITIDEVRAENGCLRLMKNLVWEYDALPHALIAGGTGGGKTYFLLTLIEALLHTNAILYILDPKNADLADLGTVMGNVYHTKEEMIDCVNAFYAVSYTHLDVYKRQSLEYVKQYGEAHKELNYKQVYLLEQCVVWQRLSVHLGWQCDNVRASYDEIPKATQDEVFSGAKAFVKENKGRYECGLSLIHI